MLSPLRFSGFHYEKPPADMPYITVDTKRPGQDSVLVYVTAPEATPALMAKAGKEAWEHRHNGANPLSGAFINLEMIYVQALRAVGDLVLEFLGGRSPARSGEGVAMDGSKRHH